jgi:hypothetical protein
LEMVKQNALLAWQPIQDASDTVPFPYVVSQSFIFFVT